MRKHVLDGVAQLIERRSQHLRRWDVLFLAACSWIRFLNSRANGQNENNSEDYLHEKCVLSSHCAVGIGSTPSKYIYLLMKLS